MEQYDFKLIPVPVEALEAVGLVAGAMAEAFVDGSRLIIQKAQGDAVAKPTMKTVKAVLTAAPAAANA